ncbi:flagellar export chaperone FlgN [Thalassolituus alkanivorans]|uniref:flagellar export chaperone FlgN n=1 Tax=Thalassolituus alkanivorans TaxID=2881055 RepID=UPI001E52217A|nr:flagellar export chaperone FlgN [Thalassolituus alkanivorans]MCB2385238.1 flagellar protein FlgN [Thalassolituus alkanivorans]MCB2421905.1 flagellar protein FlgN [Thalassolituus alkanivorans]
MSTDIALFAAFLQTELELTTGIHAILEQERDALANNDLQGLQTLQQEKALCLRQLQDHAEQRLLWMKASGLPQSAQCLQHPDIAAAANIRLLWSNLENQYKQNQKLSVQLSDIVLHARHRTLQKLKILRGQQNDPHLYNDKGKASSLKQGQGYIQV